MTQKFYVNSDERTCRVTLECDEGTFNGIATCSEEDKFDVIRGLAIANKRALLQVKQADIRQFNEEVKSYEDRINELLDVAKKYGRAKRKLNAAKKCLSDLYHEIHLLTQDDENTTVEE